MKNGCFLMETSVFNVSGLLFSVQPLNRAVFDVIESTDDFEVCVFGQNAANTFCLPEGVSAAGGDGVDSSFDSLDDIFGDDADMPFCMTFKGGTDCTAVCVSQHDCQRNTEMFGGIFDTSQLGVVDDIAGNADSEDFADPAVRIIRYAAQRRVELLSGETGT